MPIEARLISLLQETDRETIPRPITETEARRGELLRRVTEDRPAKIISDFSGPEEKVFLANCTEADICGSVWVVNRSDFRADGGIPSNILEKGLQHTVVTGEPFERIISPERSEAAKLVIYFTFT